MAQIGEVRVPSAPLNQEDLLGTLSTFTTVTFMALEKLAVSFDDDDRRAFHHLWNIIGWHLGIGDAESVGDIPVGSRPTWPHNRVLPLEFDEMDDLAHRLAARLQGPSDAGARLAKTLVQELAYPLPNRAHGAPDFLVRYMVGDAQADALQLGAGDTRSSSCANPVRSRQSRDVPARLGSRDWRFPRRPRRSRGTRCGCSCRSRAALRAGSASSPASRTAGVCRRAPRYDRGCAPEAAVLRSVRGGREVPDADQGPGRELDRRAPAHPCPGDGRRGGSVTESPKEHVPGRGQVGPIGR